MSQLIDTQTVALAAGTTADFTVPTGADEVLIFYPAISSGTVDIQGNFDAGATFYRLLGVDAPSQVGAATTASIIRATCAGLGKVRALFGAAQTLDVKAVFIKY